MTRTDLLTQWAYRLNKTPPPNMDSATQARAIGYFNQRQRRLLTLPGLRHLREATITFTSVVGQATYALQNIGKISRIVDSTNQRILYEMSQQDQRMIDPFITISGTPEAFIWLNNALQVAAQPATTGLWVASDSAADITQTLYIEGVLTGNVPAASNVQLLGATITQIGAFTTWERIDKCVLSATCDGNVTLYSDVGGTVPLAFIPLGQTSATYDGCVLWPTPSSAITYVVDITRAVTDFSQATDEPLLPLDFHDLILLGAVADEYQHLNDPRWQIVMSEYTQRVGELKYWLAETATGRPFTLTRGWQRPSQLGSWFPSGT